MQRTVKAPQINTMRIMEIVANPSSSSPLARVGMMRPSGARNPKRPKTAARCIPAFKFLRAKSEERRRGRPTKEGMRAVTLTIPPAKYPRSPRMMSRAPAEIPF